jgi:hypothetical protein
MAQLVSRLSAAVEVARLGSWQGPAVPGVWISSYATPLLARTQSTLLLYLIYMILASCEDALSVLGGFIASSSCGRRPYEMLDTNLWPISIFVVSYLNLCHIIQVPKQLSHPMAITPPS